ncbi:MAG: hypothetical protein ACO23W_07600 [Chitinophagaceae bacterium]
MLQLSNISFNNLTRIFGAMFIVLTISATAFAIDGIVMKSKSSKSSFSNMKKHLSLSLRDGFSYRDNKAFGFKRHGNAVMFNNVITYQKGNVTYIIPYKNRVVLNKFKTPVKPQQ